MWIKIKLLKQNHLVSHCMKEKWCFVPTDEIPPFLKASSLFLSFFEGLDLQLKQITVIEVQSLSSSP